MPTYSWRPRGSRLRRAVVAALAGTALIGCGSSQEHSPESTSEVPSHEGGDDAQAGAGQAAPVDPLDSEGHVRWFFTAMANGNSADACSWLTSSAQLKLNQIVNDLANTGYVPCAEGLDALFAAKPDFQSQAKSVEISFDGGGTKETPT